MADWVAYELVDGKAYVLKRASRKACEDHVLCTPKGPRGGSVHVKHRPLKAGKRK